jgi:hypothetical protein
MATATSRPRRDQAKTASVCVDISGSWALSPSTVRRIALTSSRLIAA